MKFVSSHLTFLLFTFGLLSTSLRPTVAEEPLKVFILAGQSNMVGHARAHTMAPLLQSDFERDQQLVDLVFADNHTLSKALLEEHLALGRRIDELTGGIRKEKIKATPEGPERKALEDTVAKLEAKLEDYKRQVSAACVVSDRVYLASVADRNTRAGQLSIGYGADRQKIGPEYTFGLSIAREIDGPILIIKTAWGGKSLHYDFRPPSAGPYQLTEKQKSKEQPKDIAANAGQFYRKMNAAVQEVLNDLPKYHPSYDPESGYEVCGFVWFQGFNDQFEPEFRDNYRANMVALINDVRAEYASPNLPFVIGVLGTGVSAEKVAENMVSVAQRKAAQTPQLKGTVAAVESYTQYSHFSNRIFQKGWPEHYHEWDLVGSDRPYHYLGSGMFFARLGDAFASAMIGLLSDQTH